MYTYPYMFYMPSIMQTYSITINRASRTLAVYRSGQWFKSYPIAIGKPSTPTPTGTHNPSYIGKAVSNGCVRMYNNDVIELANTVPIGTVVKIV